MLAWKPFPPEKCIESVTCQKFSEPKKDLFLSQLKLTPAQLSPTLARFILTNQPSPKSTQPIAKLPVRSRLVFGTYHQEEPYHWCCVCDCIIISESIKLTPAQLSSTHARFILTNQPSPKPPQPAELPGSVSVPSTHSSSEGQCHPPSYIQSISLPLISMSASENQELWELAASK